MMVKTKWWHKKLQGDRHKGRLTSPYVVGYIKGPSPLMSSGWVVKGQSGHAQHARAVIQTGPHADIAISELEEDPTRPLRRLHGKQRFTTESHSRCWWILLCVMLQALKNLKSPTGRKVL
jgi:hypothetical protein